MRRCVMVVLVAVLAGCGRTAPVTSEVVDDGILLFCWACREVLSVEPVAVGDAFICGACGEAFQVVDVDRGLTLPVDITHIPHPLDPVRPRDVGEDPAVERVMTVGELLRRRGQYQRVATMKQSTLEELKADKNPDRGSVD